jgi:hypothetical protein
MRCRSKIEIGLKIVQRFHEFISQLEFAGKGVNMIADIRESANVQNCGHEFAVDENAVGLWKIKLFEASNNDSLQQSGDYESTSDASQPVCNPGYSGRKCDIVVDVCLANEPCENGGICTTVPGNKYKCDCTLGYNGDNCQYMIAIQKSCGFRGNGYLELDRNTIANGSRQAAGGFAVMFSTRQPNGLLAWYGQGKGKAFDGEDFMSLAIVEGILEFAFRHDGQESYIRHIARVDSGQRHVAIVKRTGNQYNLELDGLLEYGESRPTGKKDMELEGNVFLGEFER